MSGEISKYEDSNFPGSSARNWTYAQEGHHGNRITPLPYDMLNVRATAARSFSSGVLVPLIDAPNSYSCYEFVVTNGIPAWSQPAANAAYERFRERATGSTSSLGAAFGEWKDSLGMIANRGIQLAQSARALRNRDFPALYRAWRGRPHRRGSRQREMADKCSSLWLEYSFGWKPLVGDIMSAMEQIGEPLLSSSYSGSARTSNYYRWDNAPYGWSSRNSSIRHATGAYVTLDNPNLYLASQLGLVNPASVAWELIPGSFIADWMFDVSSFLNSYSDFAGVNVQHPWQSHKCQYTDLVYSVNLDGPCVGSGVCFSRGTTLIRPMPNMEVRANLGSSVSRALNATALATQAFLALTR